LHHYYNFLIGEFTLLTKLMFMGGPKALRLRMSQVMLYGEIYLIQVFKD